MKFSNRFFEESPHLILVATVFLLPILFFPWTVDLLEVNKQTLLVWAAILATLLWAGRFLEQRSGTIRVGWFLLLPAFFLLATAVSTVVSLGGFVSWVGESMQEYQSLLSIAALCVLFFLLVQTTTDERHERRLFAAVLFSGAAVLALFFFRLFGGQLPFAWTNTVVFNTIGTVNALVLFCLIVSIFGQALWLVSGREERDVLYRGALGRVEKAAILLVSLGTLVLLLAVDFWALWVVAIAGMIPLFAFGIARAHEFPYTRRFILSMGFLVVSILFLFLPRPFTFRIPVEVTPSVQASMQIAKHVWQDHSLWFGSGPGTFAFDYARYRSQELNQTVLWNTRFDRAHSYFLTLLATHGVVGAGIFAVFIFGIFGVILHRLLLLSSHREWKIFFVLSSAWMATAVSAFLYSWNLTLLSFFFFFSAMVLAQVIQPRSLELQTSPRARLSMSFLFVVFGVAILTIFFVTVGRYRAEVAFAQALRADREQASATDVVAHLVRAAELNQYHDVYYRNLSQAFLWQIQGILASQAGDGKQDQIASLVNGAVNTAKRATDLSPWSALNWLNRGQVYRELLALVSGAGEFGRVSFERAADLEPHNPVPLMELGRLSFVQAQILMQDGNNVSDIVKQKNALLAKAEEDLGLALKEKGDYAPAHYYLALVYQEEGRAKEALAKMRELSRNNPRDVGVQFQLGVLLMRQGEADQAKKTFTSVLDLAPTYANARWFLASLYEQEWNRQQAIAEIKKILDTDPGNPLVLARLKHLQENAAPAAVEPLPESSSKDAAIQP